MSDLSGIEESHTISSGEEHAQGCVDKVDGLLYSRLGEKLSLPRRRHDRYAFWLLLLVLFVANVGNFIWVILKFCSRRPAVEDAGIAHPSVFPKVTVVACPAYDWRYVSNECHLDLGVRWSTWLSFMSTSLQKTHRFEYMDGQPHAKITNVSDLQRLQKALKDEDLELAEDFFLQAPHWHGPFAQVVFPKGWRLRPCEGCNWTRTNLLADMNRTMDLTNITDGLIVNFVPVPGYPMNTGNSTIAGSRVMCLFQPLPPISSSDVAAQFVDLTISHPKKTGQCTFNSVYMAFVDSDKTKEFQIQNASSVQVWDDHQIDVSLSAQHFEDIAGSSSYQFTVTNTKVGQPEWCKGKVCLYLGSTNLNWRIPKFKETYVYTVESVMTQILSGFNFTLSVLAFLFPLKIYLSQSDTEPLAASRKLVADVPTTPPVCSQSIALLPERFSPTSRTTVGAVA